MPQKMLSKLDYPLFIVTTVGDGERSGCLVGFTTQCSIDPIRFIVCLSKKNHTYGVAMRADSLAVHLVPSDRRDLAELFGGETGDEIDKFERCSWSDGPRGLPIVHGCDALFVGNILERFDGGDHGGFILDVVSRDAADDIDPLMFQSAMDIDPGHDP